MSHESIYALSSTSRHTEISFENARKKNITGLTIAQKLEVNHAEVSHPGAPFFIYFFRPTTFELAPECSLSGKLLGRPTGRRPHTNPRTILHCGSVLVCVRMC